MTTVRKRLLSLSIPALLFVSFITWSCTKLDTTDIGSDLLPAVDNVHTFDTTLSIITSQGIFNDSTYVYESDDHVLGRISNDLLFGQTTANVFFQPKPAAYPYAYGNFKDTLVALDSVVLCLPYKGFFGDSLTPVQLSVQQIFNAGFRDSSDVGRNVNYSVTTAGSLGPVLGTTLVDVRRMKDTVYYGNHRDYSVNVIRIKLDPTFAAQLYGRDSISGNATNNAFYNDSIFRRFYNGFAVMAGATGSTLLYTNIADTNAKIEVHYKKKNGGPVDTTFSSFKMKISSDQQGNYSASGNQVIRNRSGYPVSNPNASEIYLQTAPGTYANLNIPALGLLDNRIIHRAEIIVEQIPNGPQDEIFIGPSTIYLDLKDTGLTTKYKPIYFDLNPAIFYNPDASTGFFPEEVDFGYFGPFRREKTDLFGNRIKYYNFNITRYVQQVVTKRTPNYPMRMYAAYRVHYPQYSATSYFPAATMNSIAFGRIRVGSGTNANYRMRMRIVYSKL